MCRLVGIMRKPAGRAFQQPRICGKKGHELKRKNIIKRRLKCCVCGGEAGHWEQWHNQDTGWGICPACVTWVSRRAMEMGLADEFTQPLSFSQTYGIAGKNYEPTYQRHLGRDFAIVASFPESELGEAAANQYMEKFPGASLLGIFEGRLILAMQDDLGRQPSAAPE